MKVELSQIKTIGRDIMRPEGVMALDNGDLYTADGHGRCSKINRDGETTFFGDVGGAPNGICIDGKGNCIIANIGNGQVQSLSPDGRHEVLLTHVENKRIPAPNFPFIDSRERLWVSNSSEQENLQEALQKPVPDGSIVLIADKKSKIVAEGICFANGITLDQDEEFFYVAETMLRRVLRYKIAEDGSLTGPEVYGPENLGRLGFPDGIAFDEAGNLWVTFPALNAVGYITPKGELELAIEDPERKILNRPTNICFGWENRKIAFLGSLDGTNIPYFEAPFPGMRLIHQK
ncbi:MAG: SMP-30/gluconolactonase/LRE family protein [Deltaproteobacteria bacterium]|nr:SMP-30/gluconolactonase/LRE family protein [Deltaproteobacteria bacterium]MBW2053562.1 SMP-30/gluconolactonase/LRE family protein [Deltaproteobacteria bacterium]MBW2142105.1 SMP-30/gluconolactonase/LRE family protein [Deltaproteobacteria bacterium]